MAGRVLVVGASGQLGGVIARKLVAAGVPVRAFARTRAKLEPLGRLGADVVAGDLADLPALNAALGDVTQIVATANNNMGKGATSPRKVDVGAYQNLCAAARNARIQRLVYVSYRGATPDVLVDIFRVKWYIEDVIRRSGLPHVILRPTALMDVWIDQVIGPDLRKKRVATIFGDGTRVQNYVAVDDVAEFAVRILARPDIVKEAIDLGGPSNLSLNELVTLMERAWKVTAKRRHVPVAAMKLFPLVRPFNEVASRLMSICLFAATEAQPFTGWQAAAERFGVQPMTVEEYLQRGESPGTTADARS
jgi:uncharacterized protein YbjT (DUF2867 family)